MERNNRTALVIGGGIAGPLVALSLRRIGWDVLVADDRAPEDASTQGAWLTVAVNGLSAMRTLGVDREVMAAGFPSRTIELCSTSANGQVRVLGAVPLGGELPDGTMTHTVRRRELCVVLRRAAEAAGARFEHHRRLVSLTEDGTGVTGTFESGIEHRADVVIGADGVHSTVRRWIDPAAAGPKNAGLGDVGGFTPRAALPEDAADFSPGVYRMMFGARAFFGYTVAPDGDVWWFANPAWDGPEPLQALRAMDEPGKRAAIASLFDGEPGPMAVLVNNASGSLVATLQSALPRVRHWSRGRVVLVGDAAHAAKPSSGQGVSMAAEDAVELGRCLRDLDVKTAIDAYVGLRRRRAEAVVAYGDRNASGKAAGPIAAKIRDAMLPFILRQVAASHGRSLAWLFGHRIDWDATVSAKTSESETPRWRSPLVLSIALVALGALVLGLRHAGLLP